MNRVTTWTSLAGLLAGLCAAAAFAEEAPETFGCEANPTGDPIGGGPGYRDIHTSGDFTVRTKEELLAALKAAKPGKVVFVPDGVEIDLTGERYINIPAGVTLAGTRGLNGSPGARIFTTLKESYYLMRTAGYGVRITGLRFEGPYGGTDRVSFNSNFFSLAHGPAEVDNCEIHKFNVIGISVAGDAIHVQIHHNYIHHCTRGGLGYGVCTNSSDVHIIANKFEHCRHHIASGGNPGSGYEAAWNFVGPGAISHHFDMHGGRDRGDGTNIAGDWVHIHHNTFQARQRHVYIRGVPSQGAEVHHNWFSGPAAKKVISAGNTKVYRNVYGPEKKLEE